MDDSLKTLQDELEKQGAVLSAEARDKKQVEITRRARDRQAFFEDGQAEINRMRERAQQQAQTINNEFQLKVRPIVELVAKEKGYDLVLDSQVAFTINREYDITPQVIAKADEAKPAAAAPAAAAPAAPKPQAPRP
jgi:Skp family chaperone for outer membrane proteins